MPDAPTPLDLDAIRARATESCEKGWVLVHIATDNQAVRRVIARSEAVCGTHGDLWPCMSTDDDTKETP